jgi:carbohydrate-selective porin OprB
MTTLIRRIFLALFVVITLLCQNIFADSISENNIFSSLGLVVTGYLDFILQGSPRCNVSDKKGGVFDGAFLGAIYITKQIAEDSLIRTHFRVAKGIGINNKFDLFSSLDSNVGIINHPTNGSPELVEVLWEQDLFDKKLTIDFGRLNPTLYFDLNTAASDGTCQFLASMFVNNVAVPFPSYTLGLRAKYSVCDFLDLNYAYFNRDEDVWSDIGKNNTNFVEVTYKLYNNGNYRVLVWKDFQREYAQGFGFNLDQGLSENIVLFSRLGYQNANSPYIIKNTYCNKSWSVGFQFNGNMWSRLKDTLGIAVGQNFVEKLASKTAETQTEIYYKYALSDCFALSPIFQYVDCPHSGIIDNQSTTAKNIFTLGVRTNITF